ncbi:MAG: TPM domain-containing protein [Phormidium sp. BM_Day4_Bin.17]|nr:TPM domain-containing protein [Phormidium sp. BM_Day4_Bin.17]UCJ10581.1 MAG: TPM domain-containing protein [Phormidium sp. PBR-2020]
MISALEAENGSEIAVVTVANTASQPSPKRFATRLFNDWGIGKAEVDNGVLFLHSVDDRRVEIETGYGVEEILPDTKVGAILDQEILPRFGDNDFDGGTLAGVEAIISALSGEVFVSPEAQVGGAGFGVLVNEFVFSPLSFYVLCLTGILGLPVWIYRRTVHILDHPPKLFPLGRSRVLDPNSYGMPKVVLGSLYILSFFLCLTVLALTLILDPSAQLWLAAIGILGVSVIGRWIVAPKLQSYYTSRGFKPNDSVDNPAILILTRILSKMVEDAQS